MERIVLTIPWIVVIIQRIVETIQWMVICYCAGILKTKSDITTFQYSLLWLLYEAQYNDNVTNGYAPYNVSWINVSQSNTDSYSRTGVPYSGLPSGEFHQKLPVWGFFRNMLLGIPTDWDWEFLPPGIPTENYSRISFWNFHQKFHLGISPGYLQISYFILQELLLEIAPDTPAGDSPTNAFRWFIQIPLRILFLGIDSENHSKALQGFLQHRIFVRDLSDLGINN